MTGGSGLLGSAIRRVAAEDGWDGDYHFASRQDGDLRDRAHTRALFDRVRPTHVIHLAARVGGLFANQADNRGFFVDNMEINKNVLEACRETGVHKVVSCLSTCVFPDGARLPLRATDVHAGPPHPSNEGYSYAKRMLEVMSRLYTRETGRPYVCVVPTNMYGPHDNFGLHGAHVVPALIHRALLAVGAPLAVRGTGAPLRQFLYADDAARMIGHVLMHYDGPAPMVLTNPEEVSIAHAARLVAAHFGARLVFDGDATANGQHRKTASADGILRLMPGFAFTPLERGIRATAAWLTDNYATART